MRILIIEPARRPELREIDGSLKAMQGIVGGLIQPIYPFDEPVALVCNDEGKLLGLPMNRALRDENGTICDILYGTFFICGIGEEHFVSLTEKQAEKFSQLFAVPEMFLKADGHLLVLPLE